MKEQRWKTPLTYSVLALIILLAVIFYLKQVNYDFINSTGDNYSYELIAQSVFSDHPFMINVKFDYYDEHPIFHHQRSFPPLYPILLAFSHLLFGPGMYVVIYTAIGCAIFCAVPIFLTGRLLSNNQTGLLAALLTIFSLTLVRAAYLALSEPLFLLMSLWSLYFFLAYEERKSYRDLALAALFSGLAYLTRANGLAVVVAFSSYLLLKNSLPNQHTSWRRIGLELGSYLGITLLVAAPWLARNYLVFGDPFYYVGRFFAGLKPGMTYSGIFEQAPTLETFLTNTTWREIVSRYALSAVEHLKLIWKEISLLSVLAVSSLLLWRRFYVQLTILWLYLCFNFVISLFHPYVYSRHIISLYPVLYLLAAFFVLNFKLVKPIYLFKGPLVPRIVLVLFFFAGAIITIQQDLRSPLKLGAFSKVYAPVGKWLRQNSPEDAVVMTNKTSPVAYHANRQVVMLPLYVYPQTFDKMVKTFKVDYIVTMDYEDYVPPNFQKKWRSLIRFKNYNLGVFIYQRSGS